MLLDSSLAPGLGFRLIGQSERTFFGLESVRLHAILWGVVFGVVLFIANGSVALLFDRLLLNMVFIIAEVRRDLQPFVRYIRVVL